LATLRTEETQVATAAIVDGTGVRSYVCLGRDEGRDGRRGKGGREGGRKKGREGGREGEGGRECLIVACSIPNNVNVTVNKMLSYSAPLWGAVCANTNINVFIYK